MSTDTLDPNEGLPSEDQAEILTAMDTELFLDLDNPKSISTFRSSLGFLQLEEEITGIERWRSKTKGHWHVAIKLYHGMEFYERIAWQLFLGSDRTKELLSMRRYREGHGEIIRLFMPKGKGGELVAVYNSEGTEEIEALTREDSAWK